MTLVLAENIDISRGDLLADPADAPRPAKTVRARLCWLSSEPIDARALATTRLVLKHTTRSIRAKLLSLDHRIDVNSLESQPMPAGIAMNDIAQVSIALAQPIFADSYGSNRATGCFILIDETSNESVAAGMIDG